MRVCESEPKQIKLYMMYLNAELASRQAWRDPKFGSRDIFPWARRLEVGTLNIPTPVFDPWPDRAAQHSMA